MSAVPIHIDPVTWDACKAGNKEAYATIYTQYYPRLYNYGHKFTTHSHLVEDCIQEIFTRFWLNRDKLAAIKELRSYLFVSFRHYLLQQLAQPASLHADIAQHTENEFLLELSPEQEMLDAEYMYVQQVQLRKAMKALTQRQKEALFFRFYENMSYEEIAQILHITTKATYKLVARAIAELRKAYNSPLVSLLLSISGLGMLLPLPFQIF